MFSLWGNLDVYITQINNNKFQVGSTTGLGYTLSDSEDVIVFYTYIDYFIYFSIVVW